MRDGALVHTMRLHFWQHIEHAQKGMGHMNGFFDRMRASMQTFMVGRYGFDTFSFALIVVALAINLIASFTGFGLATGISLVLLVLAIFRMLSTDTARRAAEQERFEKLTRTPAQKLKLAAKRWKNRKTTCYFTCENCKTVYSLPKGKGTVRARCPKCHEQTIRTT